MHWSICDCILDIGHNALHSHPTSVRVTIEEDFRQFGFCITDDGCGMDEQQQQRARDPFYSDRKNHPERRVGLGLPLLIQTAEAVAGSCQLNSAPNRGTRVAARFPLDNIDTPPIGDVPGTIASLMGYAPGCELVVIRALTGRHGRNSYTVSRSELQAALGNIEAIQSIQLAQDYIRSQEDWLKGESTDGTNES